MSKPASLPVAFEPEFIAGLRQIFEEKIPFNHLLGLKITRLEPAAVAARIERAIRSGENRGSQPRPR